jgi:hypothetical protein
MAAEYKIDILCAEEKAYLIPGSEESRALVNDRVFKRAWKGIPNKFLESITADLRARRTYTAPQADLKEFPGVWRQVSVQHLIGKAESDGQIIESLALGFLQAFVSPDTDVRLFKVEVVPEIPTLTLTQVWRYCDPLKADDMIVALQGIKTVTNPVADGQAYTGTYTVEKAWGEKQEDGSVDIFRTMNSGLLTDFEYTYAKNCKEDVRLIVKEGLSKTVLEAAIVEFQRAAYSPGVMNEITVGFDTQRGLYTLSVRQHIAIKVTQAQYQSYGSAARTDLEDKVINDTTATPLDTTRVAGEIIRSTVELNEMCQYDKDRVKATVIDQEATDYDNNAAREITRLKHTEADAPLADPGVPTPGTMKRRVNQPTESGKNQTIDETVTAIDQTAKDYDNNAAREIERTKHTEADAPLADPLVPTPGTMVRRTTQPNESGKNQTVDEVVTVIDQTATDYDNNAAREITRLKHTENPAALDDPLVPTPGTMKRRINQPTESGEVQTVDETIEVIDQTATDYDKNAARLIERVKHTEGAVVADPDPGNPPAAGTLLRIINDETESGKERTVLETTTVIDQTSTDYDNNAARTIRRDKRTENDAALADPLVPTPGTMKRRINQPNESGKLQTVDETVTVVPQLSTDYDKAIGHTTSISKNTEGDAVAEPTPATGTQVVVKNDPTESGKNRTVSEQTVFNMLTFLLSYSSGYSTKQYLHRSHATAAQLAVDKAAYLTATTNNSASGSQEDNGLLEYSMDTRTPDDVDGGAWTAYSFTGVAEYNGVLRAFKVWVQYFAIRSGAEAFLKVDAQSGYQTHDGIRGHVTGIKGPMVGQFIFEGKRVEVADKATTWGIS